MTELSGCKIEISVESLRRTLMFFSVLLEAHKDEQVSSSNVMQMHKQSAIE